MYHFSEHIYPIKYSFTQKYHFCKLVDFLAVVPTEGDGKGMPCPSQFQWNCKSHWHLCTIWIINLSFKVIQQTINWKQHPEHVKFNILHHIQHITIRTFLKISIAIAIRTFLKILISISVSIRTSWVKNNLCSIDFRSSWIDFLHCWDPSKHHH